MERNALWKVNGMQPDWRKTRGAESSGTNRTISRSKTKIDKCVRDRNRWANRVKRKSVEEESWYIYEIEC